MVAKVGYTGATGLATAGNAPAVDYLLGQGRNFFSKLDKGQLQTSPISQERVKTLEQRREAESGKSVVEARLANGPNGERRSVLVLDAQVWVRAESQASTFGRPSTWFLVNKTAPPSLAAGLPSGIVG